MIDTLLRLSKRRPRVRFETVRRAELTEERIDELYALSNRLTREERAHFAVHARENELVHVFRRTDTHEVVGFQFWRTEPLNLPRSRVIAGGKLRVLPEFRNRALHLLSGMVFFLQNKVRHPRTRFYRISLASVLGFVSVTESIAEYTLWDPSRRDGEDGAIRDAFVSFIDQNGYRLDEETGLVFVDIYMTAETLALYPARFFERPAAKVYASVNPDFRTNGRYVAFWFRFTPRNIASLAKTIVRKSSR